MFLIGNWRDECFRNCFGSAANLVKLVGYCGKHHRNGYDSGIQRADRAVTSVRLPTPLRWPMTSSFDRSGGDLGGGLKCRLQVVLSVAGEFIDFIQRRDDRIKQRLIADLRAATSHHPLDGGSSHFDEVSRCKFCFAFRFQAGLKKRRAPNGSGRAARMRCEYRAHLDKEGSYVGPIHRGQSR